MKLLCISAHFALGRILRQVYADCSRALSLSQHKVASHSLIMSWWRRWPPHGGRGPKLLEGRAAAAHFVCCVLWSCGCVVLWVCDSLCAYVVPYHSIFLHTHFQKFVKCQLKPTQTAPTSSILCRRYGPIWPKLERHRRVVPTRHDMSATFPAKLSGNLCLMIVVMKGGALS